MKRCTCTCNLLRYSKWRSPTKLSKQRYSKKTRATAASSSSSEQLDFFFIPPPSIRSGSLACRDIYSIYVLSSRFLQPPCLIVNRLVVSGRPCLRPSLLSRIHCCTCLLSGVLHTARGMNPTLAFCRLFRSKSSRCRISCSFLDSLALYTLATITAGRAWKRRPSLSSRAGSRFKMWKTRASVEALAALLAHVCMAGGACVQPSISMATTTLDSISGCYQESIYGGLFETKVWTIDGSDIVAPTGTKAIVADLVSPLRSITEAILFVLRCTAHDTYPTYDTPMFFTPSVPARTSSARGMSKYSNIHTKDGSMFRAMLFLSSPHVREEKSKRAYTP